MYIDTIKVPKLREQQAQVQNLKQVKREMDENYKDAIIAIIKTEN